MKKNWDNSRVRDGLIVIVLIGAALFVTLTPITKYSAGERIKLSSIVPSAFGAWTSVEFNLSDYSDKWQSINEVIQRLYTNTKTKEQVLLIIEYSSDLRRNFTFHFPEGCYRAAGYEVVSLAPTNIPLLGGKSLPLKNLYIHREENDSSVNKIISYWLVIDNKQYSQTFFIKFDQFFAGIFSKAKKGFLVRIDSFEGLRYNDEMIAKVNATTDKFVADLYKALDEKKRVMLFGRRDQL